MIWILDNYFRNIKEKEVTPLFFVVDYALLFELSQFEKITIDNAHNVISTEWGERRNSLDITHSQKNTVNHLEVA